MRNGSSTGAETSRASTYVLVHGGFHGGWCWKDVASRLRMAGHEVYAPTLTGLGERSHLLYCAPTLETWIEDIMQVIRYESLEDIILVGHSFAGPIITAIADRAPSRLRHLVFLDAQILQPGESSADRIPERVELYRKRGQQIGSVTVIPVGEPRDFGVADADAAKSLARKLTPHPLQTYYDPLYLTNPLGNGVPATYIACSKPFFRSTELARSIAKGMPGWKYLEIATGHNAMITAPDELASMLLVISG